MRQRLIKGSLPLALGLAFILGVCGCGKKATQEVTPQPTPATPTQTPAQQPPPQQSQPAMQPAAPANNEPDLAELNRNLIRWVVRNKRRPASFEEFAATAGAPIPPPPAGKKYVIAANMHVQLVNQ